jgi:glycosyltransferase 2 family protein
VDLAGVLAALSGANLALVVPALVAYFAGVWLRACRWRRLVSPFADVPSSRLFRVILIGFAVNNVLPLRLGEIVRAFLLRHSHEVPIAGSLASILLERVLDLVVLAGFMVVVSSFVPLDGWLAALATLAWAGVLAAVLALLVLLLTPRGVLHGVLNFAVAASGQISPKLAKLVGSFFNGISAVETPRAVLSVGFLSIACWIAELGLYYFLMLAFGFDSGILSLFAGMVAANLATALPSSPGYVGTFDVPLQSVLSDQFGVPVLVASSYTLLAHAVLLIPVVLTGLPLLFKENLSLRALGRGKVELRSARREGAPVAVLPD